MHPQSRTWRGLTVAGAIGLDLVVWGGATRTTTGSEIATWLPVVVTVAGHQTLWLLRTRPDLVLSAQSALALVSLLIPKWQPFAGLLLATYAASAQRGARRTYLLLAGVLLALLSHSYASARLTAVPWTSTATLLLLWVGFVAAIWGLGVRHHHGARHAWWSTSLAAARAERDLLGERLRIARDLHDGVCGAVTAIHLQAAGARHVARPDQATQSLEAIESSAERTLLELRRVVGSLRHSGHDEDPPDLPTLAELPALLAVARHTGLHVTFSEIGRPTAAARLDPGTEVTVVRTVQEALTNALKHAGPAATCAVQLAWAHDQLQVTVESRPSHGPVHGRRLERPSGWSARQGLQGLAERAALAGGQLRAGPVEHGYAVRLTVPARAELVP